MSTQTAQNAYYQNVLFGPNNAAIYASIGFNPSLWQLQFTQQQLREQEEKSSEHQKIHHQLSSSVCGDINSVDNANNVRCLVFDEDHNYYIESNDKLSEHRFQSPSSCKSRSNSVTSDNHGVLASSPCDSSSLASSDTASRSTCLSILHQIDKDCANEIVDVKSPCDDEEESHYNGYIRPRALSGQSEVSSHYSSEESNDANNVSDSCCNNEEDKDEILIPLPSTKSMEFANTALQAKLYHQQMHQQQCNNMTQEQYYYYCYCYHQLSQNANNYIPSQQQFDEYPNLLCYQQPQPLQYTSNQQLQYSFYQQ